MRWGSPASSCSWWRRAPASRFPARRRCCSRASTSRTASTACSRPWPSGSIANLVGSWIAYWVGYAGRVDILEKHGKKLHIKKSHLEWADRWFERHGDATVFFTRMLPIIRTFISLPAGVARMPFWRFSVLTLAGLRAVGADAHLHRQAGRRQLGGLEGQPPLRGLRRGRDASWPAWST